MTWKWEFRCAATLQHGREIRLHDSKVKGARHTPATWPMLLYLLGGTLCSSLPWPHCFSACATSQWWVLSSAVTWSFWAYCSPSTCCSLMGACSLCCYLCHTPESFLNPGLLWGAPACLCFALCLTLLNFLSRPPSPLPPFLHGFHAFEAHGEGCFVLPITTRFSTQLF